MGFVQQVAKNFREIFGELAPGGRGELVMQKRLRPEPQEDVDPEDEEEAGPSDRADAMERYAGVKVKVKRPPLVFRNPISLTKSVSLLVLSQATACVIPGNSLCQPLKQLVSSRETAYGRCLCYFCMISQIWYLRLNDHAW